MENKTLEQLIHKHKIPGVSIATVSGSGEIINRVSGISNKNNPIKITDETIFEVASLSKPVFAYIVLKMVESKQLSLNQPLYEIAPEFGPESLRNHPYYKMLTVEKILSHQAGLPNWFEPGKAEDYVAQPGERFDYSGLAFCFLNDVIEKVSGKPLEALAQEVFENLGMNNSSFLPYKESKLNKKLRATGHNTDEKPDEKEHFLKSNPAASLLTTAEDYAKFLQKCINDDFIRKHMLEPKINLSNKDKKAIDAGVSPKILEDLNWSMGMGLQTTKDGTTAFHWGDNETNRAFAAVNLQTKQAVVCLTNSANGPSIFQKIVEPIVGKINAISHWLSQREGLTLRTEHTKTSSPAEIGFFKNKHSTEKEHTKLQHQDDKKSEITPK